MTKFLFVILWRRFKQRAAKNRSLFSLRCSCRQKRLNGPYPGIVAKMATRTGQAAPEKQSAFPTVKGRLSGSERMKPVSFNTVLVYRHVDSRDPRSAGP